MPSLTPRVVHRSLSIPLARRHWRRLRRVSSRLLLIALLFCVVTGPNVSTVSAAPPPQAPSIEPALEHPPAPDQSPPGITYITPQITQTGSISETLNPSSVQLQPTPDRRNVTGPIPLASCFSPDYIFQDCLLVPAGEDTGSLRRLEGQAVATVLQQYQLPDSDRSRVLRYARNEVRTALYAQVLAAFKTPAAQRSPDQRVLADGYTRLVGEKRTQAARSSLNEYRQWSIGPCSYRPPQGFTYDPPGLGACMGIGALFGAAESPGYDAFVSYGTARVYTGTDEATAAGFKKQSLSDPGASDVARATSYGAVAAYGIAAAAPLAVVGAAAGSALPAAAVTAIFPFALNAAVTLSGTAAAGAAAITGTAVGTGGAATATTGAAVGAGGGGSAAAIGAATVAGVVAIVVVAVVIGVMQGIKVFREVEIPNKLQDLINTAGTQDPLVCFSATSTASTDQCQNAQKELFANFLLSTLPDYPGTDPAPTTPTGDLPYVNGRGAPVDWVQYTADDGTQRAFRFLSGQWFADRAGSDGTGIPTLSIKYRGSSGAKWLVNRVGHKFSNVRADIAPTEPNYPPPQQSQSLSVPDWSGNILTVQYGG